MDKNKYITLGIESIKIFTDSKSIIDSLMQQYPSNRTIYELIAVQQEIPIDVTIGWVKSHIGIPGNELADIQAKLSLLSKCPMK